MPKYLFKGRYSVEGARGLQSEGGTARREAVRSVVEGAGGTLEAYYFAFGDVDVYAIADLPDHTAATAVSLTIGASGAAGVETVVLLDPGEVDAAVQQHPSYRPPGA
jgi:uncharacterized protein with GYD domain